MKLFVVFATLLSLAFCQPRPRPDVDLSTCLNPDSAKDHHDKIEACQAVTDSKEQLDCDATHDQVVKAAATSHVHGMCIMEQFGWVNSEGDLQTEAMINDLINNVLNGDASQKLKTAMQDEQTGFKKCMETMVKIQKKAAKKKHDQWLENCKQGNENAELFTEEEVKAQQQAHGIRGAQTAAAHCLMLEVGKACGAKPKKA